MNLDALFLHPPSIYDFRKRPMFPGPVFQDGTSQFIAIPVGLLSIAEYIKRRGYKVRVVNLGDFMIKLTDFDVEKYIMDHHAKVYAIDLHWCVHSQGAIEIARICKKLHPSSLVVLGGLTATYFHREIIEKFRFIDMIVRGEGEKPFLQILENYEKSRRNLNVPNLTYQGEDDKVHVNPLTQPSKNLDEYEFTCLELVIPKVSVWYIPICRGCTYNCVSCGGSSYSYKTLFGMNKPAFRAPTKIAEDLKRLEEQGIRQVFLFQDPHMGGRKYWKELISAVRSEKPDLTLLGMDLFSPADKEFLMDLASLKIPTVLTISPESGVESVRRAHGREYSNEDLLKTMEHCIKYQIRLGIFFMVGLANETCETIRETLKFCERICELDRRMRRSKDEKRFQGPLWLKPEVGVMILLDPGSLAFNFPEKYGYSLFFKKFIDHYNGLSMPFWHQWISYETRFMDKSGIAHLSVEFLDKIIYLHEKYGLYEAGLDNAGFSFEHFKNRVNLFLIEEGYRIQQLTNRKERDMRLKDLRETLNIYMSPRVLSKIKISKEVDLYDYRKRFEEILHLSTGLICGY